MAEKKTATKPKKGPGRPKGPRPMKAATFANHLDEMIASTGVGVDDPVGTLIAEVEKQIVAEARKG